jgi:hypothetical protein
LLIDYLAIFVNDRLFVAPSNSRRNPFLPDLLLTFEAAARL